MSSEKRYMDDVIEVEQINKGDSLFHYTTAQGIKGIIENRQFWVSKHDFLNDPTEFEYIQLILLASIHRYMGKGENVDKFERVLNKKIVDWSVADDFREGYYVISFSTMQDNLTLWSEFSGGMGYNIEFNGDNLIELIQKKNPIMWHGKVIYNQEMQFEKIRKLIFETAAEKIQMTFEEIMNLPEDDIDFNAFMDIVSIGYIVYGMFFKNNSFYDENEYRIIISAFHEGKNRIERLFREKDDFLIPYIKVDMENKERKLPINSITVGPKNHMDLAIKGMELFMKDNTYDIKIKKSFIPLRY